MTEERLCCVSGEVERTHTDVLSGNTLLQDEWDLRADRHCDELESISILSMDRSA